MSKERYTKYIPKLHEKIMKIIITDNKNLNLDLKNIIKSDLLAMIKEINRLQKYIEENTDQEYKRIITKICNALKIELDESSKRNLNNILRFLKQLPKKKSKKIQIRNILRLSLKFATVKNRVG
ncbi:27316_t:CDS:1 [Racocetra persica]|uniref:27316_t:CDS:1 n=1 Tax=Racocetra persica TaxID=160502 RepID=A0ACA9KL45_9GLOM|nr:27316_t:CDS:1 [Racocetra persica]